MAICECCGNEYAKSVKHQKYCSSRCREKQWFLDHGDRYRDTQKRHRMKQVVLCRFCNKPIPNEMRKCGLCLCSEECRKSQQRRNAKDRRARLVAEFMQYKTDVGCAICGYDKFGGAIDFHHINPTEKERRITHGNWLTKSVQEEIGKCVLLCKCCHYEVHYLFRQDPDRYWEIMEKTCNI